MPVITRYIAFVNPPNNLFKTVEQANAAAEEMAKASLGVVAQVWRLDGVRLSTVRAGIETEVTQDE